MQTFVRCSGHYIYTHWHLITYIHIRTWASHHKYTQYTSRHLITYIHTYTSAPHYIYTYRHLHITFHLGYIYMCKYIPASHYMCTYAHIGTSLYMYISASAYHLPYAGTHVYIHTCKCIPASAYHHPCPGRIRHLAQRRLPGKRNKKKFSRVRTLAHCQFKSH